MSAEDVYLEVLPREECLRLLPTVPVGWIASCHASRPQLVPVNFVVHEDEVVVRTSYGSKLAAAAAELVMSLGVDSLDPATHTGWSVTVTGRARLIGHLDDLAVVDIPPLEAWAPGEKEFLIGIPIGEVSGRRIRLPDGSPRSPH